MEDNRVAAFIYPALRAEVPPTLKDVFDNLRNYPLLAIMHAGFSLLPQSNSSTWKVASVFWGALLVLLLLFSALQTGLVLLDCFVSFFKGARALQSRAVQYVAVAVGLALFAVAVVGSFEITAALSDLRGTHK